MDMPKVQPNTQINTAQLMAILGGKPSGSDSLMYLTPEALLTYVETQLRSVDGDIRKRLEGQQDLIARKKLLGDIESALANGGANKQQIADAYQAAIDALPEGDPLRARLEAGLAKALQLGESGQLPFPLNSKEVVGQLSAALNADLCKGLEASLKNELSDLNAGSELNMIEVQSLMSQRATAVQLGTGMLQKINSTLENIANNIGR